MSRMKKVLETVKELLFPRRCPLCDEILPVGEEKICGDCLKKLRPVAAPWCMKCGKGLYTEKKYCSDCEKEIHLFSGGRSLYDYSCVAKAVYGFKYGGRQEYGEFFGEEMATLLGDYIKGIHPDVILPVPLHRKRLRKRGYNQALLLAKVIGEQLGIPVREDCLVRVKNTLPLKSQNPKERQNNLKKAFIIKENDVKLEIVLIVDDIYTTGSTMDEVAATLMDHGAKQVYFVTLAGGMGD